MRINDPFRNHFLEANSCYFGGAKMPPPPKPTPMPEPPASVPVTPIDPPAPIPPAPTTSKLEVEQASDDQKRQAARRKGVRQTLIAGETGGYNAETSASGKKTLLG